MHRATDKIILFLKRVLESIKSFQNIFKLFEILVSFVYLYITHKKIPNLQF